MISDIRGKSKSTKLSKKRTRTQEILKTYKPKEEIPVNAPIFDTDKSLLLKFSQANNIPSLFVLVFPPEKENELLPRFQTLDDYIDENFNPDEKTLQEFIQEVQKIKYQIKQDDILYTIYSKIEDDESKELFMNEASDTLNIDTHFFIDKFNDWKIGYEQLILNDSKELINIEESLKILQSVEPVSSSDIVINKITIQYTIEQVLDKDSDIFDVIPDIFANAITDFDIPYIRYNQGNKPIIKIFSGQPLEDSPVYRYIQQKITKMIDPNMLYFVMKIDRIEASEDLRKESYVAFSIDLSKKLLKFKYLPEVSIPIEDIVNKIQTTFKGIILKERLDKNFQCYFNMYGFTVEEYSLLHIILVEKMFYSFLFTDESSKPVSERKKLKIFFDSELGFQSQKSSSKTLAKKSQIGMSLTQFFSGKNDKDVSGSVYKVAEYKNDIDVKEKILGTTNVSEISIQTLELDTPYVMVKISKALTKFSVYQFCNILLRLMTLYLEEKENIDNFYKEALPEVMDPKYSILTIHKESKEDKMLGNALTLAMLAPEIFTEGYSRECQGEYQPIIVPPNEVKNWKDKKIKEGKKEIDRPIVEYAGYNFVCPNDKLPYVVLNEKRKKKKGELEFYPCCSKENITKKERETGTSSKGCENPIKTLRILKEGPYCGQLPVNIRELLQGYEPNGIFLRTGTKRSKSSTLSAILIAIQDETYINLPDEKKIIYVEYIRKKIGEDIHFEVASNELYDFTAEERKALFNDPDRYLDPSLYIRILEEIFNVNIFVFSGNHMIPSTKITFSIDLGRYNTIPMKYYDSNRKTIVLFKHWGSDTDRLNEAQTEVILLKKENEQVSLFDDSMGKYLLQAYYTIAKVYGRIYEDDEESFGDYSSKQIMRIMNSNFLVNFFDNENIKVLSQIIDGKGKLRGLNIEYKNKKITVGTPPLPTFNVKGSDDIYKTSFRYVRDLFGDSPSYFAVDKDDNIIGVWYKFFGIKKGIYIPLTGSRIEGIEEIERTRDNCFEYLFENNDAERYNRLKRDLDFVIQLTRWLYTIYQNEYEDPTLDTFFNEYIQVSKREDKNSINDYDFDQLERKIPNINEIDMALQYLNEHCPRFTDGKKIIVYSDKMKNILYLTLYQFVKYLPTMNIKTKYLDNYYTSIYDYPNYPSNMIFFNNEDADLWISNASRESMTEIPVTYFINDNFKNIQNPFYYSPKENMLTCIINVITEDKEIAIKTSVHIGRVWMNDKRMILPSMLDIVKIDEPNNYIIITSTTEKEIFVKISEHKTDDDLPMIFVYKYPNSERYAAMLSLSISK